MSIKHIGIVKNGVEMPPNEETRKWIGGEEIYLLSEKDGVIELKISVLIDKEFTKSFNEVFPKALEVVKDIAES